MNLIVTASKDTFESLLSKDIQGFILPVKNHAMRFSDEFSVDEIAQMINTIHSKDKLAYVALNAIYHEDQLEDLKNTVKNIAKQPIDGLYFADLSVFEYANEFGLKDKLIYYPETYVTNYQDMAFWQQENISSAVLSREMTLEDIENIALNTTLDVSIIGHGYLNMFHSKRRLIKTFLNYTKKDNLPSKNKQTYKLIEEIRDEAYPIYQDQFGTHIFREKPLSSIQVFDVIHRYVDHFIIDTQFYSKVQVLQIVSDYCALKRGESINKVYYKDHDDGFYHKKTVYKQGGGEQ